MKKRKHSEISESAESSELDEAQSTKPNFQTESSSLSPNPSDLDEAPPSPPPPKSTEKATKSPKTKSSSSPLKNFISQHPEYEKVALDDVMSEDDDVSILEVPSSIDSDCFIGKLINFDKKTKLKISGKKYIIEPTFEDVKPINLLSRGIKVIRPIANLKLREYHRSKSNDNIVNVDKCKLALPEKIKVRHPLFGVEYKKKIELSEEVQRKLDNSIEKALQKLKKKKKKKHEVNEESHVKNNKKQVKQETITSGDDEQDGPFFEALRSHCEKKNKTKHRLKEEVDDQFYESSVTEKNKNTHHVFPEYQEEKNEKKKRKSSFNEGFSDEKRRKHSSGTHETTFDDNNIFEEKKKDKKRKSSLSEGFSDEKRRKHETIFDSNNSFEEKKQGNNLINSTVIPGLHLPLFDFDVSGIVNKDSEVNNEDLDENEQSVKKKKKKTVKVEPETDHSVSSEGTSPKKKKKKKIKEEKEDEQTNSLIFDLLNKVKSEIDSPAKHKKKKKADG